MTVLFALSIFCGQEMIPRRIALLVDTHIPFLALKQRDRAVVGQEAAFLEAAFLEI